MAEPLPLLIPHPRLHPQDRLPAGQQGRPPRRRTGGRGGGPRPLPGRGRLRADRRHLRAAAPVVGLDAAVAAGRTVHDDVPDNVAARMVQEHGDARAAVAAAPHHLKLDLAIERSASMPMEGRGVYARWDAADRSCASTARLVSTSLRFALAVKLGVPVDRIPRWSPPTSAAASGSRSSTPWPRCWSPGPRSASGARSSGPRTSAEHFVAAAHERGQRHHVSVGFDDDGRLLGLDVEFLDNGAHPVRDRRPHHPRDPAPRPLQAGRLPGSSSARCAPAP